MATQRHCALGRRLAQAVTSAVIGGSGGEGTPFCSAVEVAALGAALRAGGPLAAKSVGRDGHLYFTVGESVVGGEDVVASE